LSSIDDLLEIDDDFQDESDGSDEEMLPVAMSVVTTRSTRHGNVSTAGVRVQRSNAGVSKAASAKVSKAALRRAAKVQEEEAMDEVEEEATQVLPDEELE